MENGNTPNPAPQGGPVKYCTACGASLHVQAEICPKCGVRQAPPPGASAGTASRKTGGGKNRWLIGCGALLALLVIGLLVLRSQYPTYLMRNYNVSAESLMRNVGITEEVLYQEHQVYGSSRHGKLPGPGGFEPQILFGPFSSATENSEGAMLTATGKDGKPVGIGIEGEADMTLVAVGGNQAGQSFYTITTKHKQGNRFYLLVSESGKEFRYFCENNAWIGQSDTDELLPPGEGVVGTPCGGSPVTTWQKL